MRVEGLRGIAAIATGEAHTLALGRDATVWAWGWNDRGQLGTATTDLCYKDVPYSRTPVQVTGLTRAVAMAAGAATTWPWSDSIPRSRSRPMRSL